MTKFAFTDQGDGYYEIEADSVDALPHWTTSLNRTEIKLPYVPPLTYRELRATAYPPVTDGLDAMVKGGQAWEDYKAACMAVKAKYPKV